MSRNATVTVAGVPLSTVGPVSGLEWSHRWEYDDVCGPSQAKWTLGVRDFAAGWFHEGAEVRVIDQGVLRWGGRLTEPQNNGAGVECHAVGLGGLAGEFEAVELVSSPPAVYQATTVPDDAIDDAIVRGLPWIRPASIGTAALGLTDGVTTTVETILLRAAKLQGKRAYVDEQGIVSLVSDPTTPRWLVGGMSDYLGTADDEFLTRLFGYYVSSVDGVTGEPDGWAFVQAEDATAAAKFGQERERTVDLTALGLLSASDAQDNIDGRFALVGGRMGWTSGFVVGRGLRLASGEPADPAAMRAGEMVVLPGVRDSRSSGTNYAAARIVLGETRHVADEDLTYCTPLGYVPRDFSSAIAAAQKPQEVEVA